MVLTLEEARKLLGETAKGCDDEELEKIVDQLDSLARAYIKGVIEGRIEIPPKILPAHEVEPDK